MRGVIAGAIGFTTVALAFAVAGVLRGDSAFAVAELLGRRLLGPGGSVNEDVSNAIAVSAWTAVHLMAFLVTGALMTAVATLLSHRPRWWYVPLLAVLLATLHAGLIPLWFATPVREVVPLWQAVAVTVGAVGLMALYLRRPARA